MSGRGGPGQLVVRVGTSILAVWLLAAVPGRAGAASPVKLLPNLVVLPTRSLVLGTATDQPVPDPDNRRVIYGCDPAEVSQEGARRCLRFDTIVANFGRGPLELHLRTDQFADGSGV